MSENEAAEAAAATGSESGENSPRERLRPPWKPGESGNPAGKPKGARHRTTEAIECLLRGEGAAIARAVIEKAKEGDVAAARLCLDRVAPARKDATVSFQLPRMETAADAIKAISAVADAVAAGDISPGEGAEFGKLIDSFTRAIEAHDLAQRIERLEGLSRK